MNKKEDIDHTSELGDIEIGKDTAYWIKRDLRTMKISFISTAKAVPMVFLIVAVVILTSFIFAQVPHNLSITLKYILAFTAICSLGYLMIHIFVTKGYNIDPYNGTTINIPIKDETASSTSIPDSSISKDKTILLLLRILSYTLLVAIILSELALYFFFRR